MKITKREWLEIVEPLLEENFPKGKCKERGNALVLIAQIFIKLSKPK